MVQNKKRPTGTLLLAGLAAYAYYKYSKMSPDQKKNLVGDWKEKGKKFYEDNVPENIKSMLGNKSGSQGNTMGGSGFNSTQQSTGQDFQNYNQGSGDQF
ncbi:MAG TPA: hypothetical protein VM888_04650 [Chitinophagaceae bacterium]|jgi:hypothetical protein|nr:hypothetical protein [Chitinophagaceae bacterium]